MPHHDYSDLVDEHAEAFDAADEAMTEAALAVLEDRITIAEAEEIIARAAEELKQRSGEWARSVLPAVVEDASQEASDALGFAASEAGDDEDQQAALELQTLELVEALENVADQMARDARGQIREGLRIRVEEGAAGVSV